MSLVDFDFKMLRCSPNNRQRLAKIYKDVQSPETRGAAERRLHLLDLLTACSFDQSRGVYVPLSETVFLPGKLQKPPVKIETLTAPIDHHFPYIYFTNPLLLPHGYDLPDFEIEHAPDPIDRLTNAGFIVITLELDCERIEEFEQNLGWFAGKDGDFACAPFAALDKELGHHHDYRGYCAVYSGRRSVHMHFVYNTKHLTNAPWEADWRSRLDSRSKTAAVMKTAHRMAWDHVHQCMARILEPLGKPDEKLRTPTQWRRVPFGINRLEKNCDFLGLSRGQLVPQIVIHENVRERRPRGSTEWLIDRHLSANITSRRRSKGGVEDEVAALDASGRALEIIRNACEAEWGAPFPRAEKLGIEGGEIIIRFANHAGDKNPSTFVKGKFRKLEVCGTNDFDRDFYLPGDLTGSGLASWAAEIADAEESRSDDDSDLTPEQRAEIIDRERRTIRGTTELYLTPQGRDRLITSIEGAGKTHSLLDSMSSEMLDRAMDAPDHAPQHFMCYAARSKQQAIEKRREYDKRHSPFDCRTVVLESFWTIYAEKCAEAETKPLERYDFESRTASEVMTTIEAHQPEVYRLLKDYRRNFWNGARFDCGTTMIFTTKATVRTWYTSRLTRTIFHPGFELGITPAQESRLAADFGLGIVAFDELELDEFLHIWTEPYYKLIESQQEVHSDWTSLVFTTRLGAYTNIRFDSSFPRPSFEQFDADMRVRLSSLEKVLVNFDAIPYGCDNSDGGLYRCQNGKPFYLGVQIGIGGRLAAPPLPHHQAYGSVPWRFDRVKPLRQCRAGGGRDRRKHGCAGLAEPPGVMTCAKIRWVNRPRPPRGTSARHGGAVP